MCFLEIIGHHEISQRNPRQPHRGHHLSQHDHRRRAGRLSNRPQNLLQRRKRQESRAEAPESARPDPGIRRRPRSRRSVRLRGRQRALLRGQPLPRDVAFRRGVENRRQEPTQTAEEMQQKDHSRMLQKSGYLTTISGSARGA